MGTTSSRMLVPPLRVPSSLSNEEMLAKTNLLLNSSSFYQFSLAEIIEATDSFDWKKEIFIDSYSDYEVYLANLSYFDVDLKSESSLAYVKRFSLYYVDSYFTEVSTMINTQVHPSFISLIGYCIQSDQKILVYKYMENGSLGNLIELPDKILSWKMRVKICLQVAYGLQHLHRPTTEFPFGIAIGHISTYNILLNENLDAKISNFDLSKINRANISDYIAHDVYDFGVILIQALCWTFEYDGPEFNDQNYKYIIDFEELLKENKALESTDELSPDSLKALSNAISKCSAAIRNRSTINAVVLDLEAALKFQELFHGMNSSSSSSRLFYSCRQFPWEEIKMATDYFDMKKIIGKGGEGTVYRGEICLNDKTKKSTVAVKHLKNGSTLEFEKEIATVAKFQHPNIVSLIGYSNELDQKALIYEYMGNGSLSDYVKTNSKIFLSWKQRLSICLDAAKGLQFLHKETSEFPKGIIHRDVKPENILIDENWIAKISDFGMLKLSDIAQTNSTLLTLNIKGTRGYFAPESLYYRKLSKKIDVYAFGFVMFEVLCRKKRWEIVEDESIYLEDDDDIGFLARENIDIDSKIKHEIADKSQQVFIDIIAESMQYDPKKRPTMDKVVLKLEEALKYQEQYEYWLVFCRNTND